MTNPTYSYLCDCVEKLEGHQAPDSEHAQLVDGILKFIREDVGYITKFADERLLESVIDRLKDDP